MNLNNNNNVELTNVNNTQLPLVNYNLSPLKENTNMSSNGGDEQNTIIVGELLQEGYDDHLNNTGSTNNVLSVDNAIGSVNNVLTAPVEEIENVFTSNNQLLDVQTNLVKCKGNNDVVRPIENLFDTQGLGRNDSEPTGFMW
jgi:hypothetical protein